VNLLKNRKKRAVGTNCSSKSKQKGLGDEIKKCTTPQKVRDEGLNE